MNRWWKFLLRAAVAFLVAVGLMFFPLPVWTPQWIVWIQVPAVVFLLVCYLGKLLYDTLFYDRVPW